jgi:hypothetical protein
LVEWKLAGETEVLGEHLHQRHYVHHKIPHDRTRVWTRAAAVGSRRLIAWATARPSSAMDTALRAGVQHVSFKFTMCRSCHISYSQRSRSVHLQAQIPGKPTGVLPVKTAGSGISRFLRARMWLCQSVFACFVLLVTKSQNSIQFNSIHFYLRANLTARRPITKYARETTKILQ